MQYRRQGAARLLLDEVDKFAMQSNISSIELDTWAANPEALEFFASRGYSVYNHLLSKHLENLN